MYATIGDKIGGSFIIKDSGTESIYLLCEQWVKKYWFRIKESQQPAYIKAGTSYLQALTNPTDVEIRLEQRGNDVILDISVNTKFLFFNVGNQIKHQMNLMILDLLDYTKAIIDRNVIHQLFNDSEGHVRFQYYFLPIWFLGVITVGGFGVYSLITAGEFVGYLFLIVWLYTFRQMILGGLKVWRLNRLIMKNLNYV